MIYKNNYKDIKYQGISEQKIIGKIQRNYQRK